MRSLAGRWAKGVAVDALIELFRRTPNDQEALKWAIGNTLEVVARASDMSRIYELSIDRQHVGRGMLVGMLWRVKDPDPVPALKELVVNPGCAFAAMSSLRRLVPPAEARAVIKPLLKDPNEGVRNAARANLRRIEKRLRQAPDSSR